VAPLPNGDSFPPFHESTQGRSNGYLAHGGKEQTKKDVVMAYNPGEMLCDCGHPNSGRDSQQMKAMRKHLAVRVVLCFSAILFFVFIIPAAEPQRASTIYFNFDKDSVSATGNWISADTKINPPFASETEIDCFKNNMMTCVEATAEFYMTHPHVTVNYLQVIRWDKDGIVATDSSGTCMTVTMQISFADKRISSTHSVKQLDDKMKESCKFFQADKTEEDIFVLKGSERWNKEHSFLPQKSEK
jgi:hypothetical protein